MKAFIKNGVVLAISSTEPIGFTDLTEVALEGRKDLPAVGWTYNAEADKFSVPEIVIPEYDLGEVQAAAIKTINDEVSSIRTSFIGTMNSQFGIYTAKYQDAKAYKLKMFGDKVEDYLWIAAEASATGATPMVVADTFISKYSAMVTAFGRAEELRMFARDCIIAAKTIKEVREAKTSSLMELKTLYQK
jgi:hypothetical protein